jgi:hypothetical protein
VKKTRRLLFRTGRLGDCVFLKAGPFGDFLFFLFSVVKTEYTYLVGTIKKAGEDWFCIIGMADNLHQ